MKFRSTAGFRGLPSSCLHLEIFEADLHRLIPELLLMALLENARNRFSYRFRQRRRRSHRLRGRRLSHRRERFNDLGWVWCPGKDSIVTFSCPNGGPRDRDRAAWRSPVRALSGPAVIIRQRSSCSTFR